MERETFLKKKESGLQSFKIQTSLKSSLLYRYYFKMVVRAVFDNAPIFNSQFSSNLYFYFEIRIEKFLLHEKRHWKSQFRIAIEVNKMGQQQNTPVTVTEFSPFFTTLVNLAIIALPNLKMHPTLGSGLNYFSSPSNDVVLKDP